MKIGILRTGHSPEQLIETSGNYDQMFQVLLAGNDFTYQTFSVVDDEFPNGPQDADGWLITGSKHGAYEDHSWIAPLEDLIRDISSTARPLVGVCFGHQIIAQALGGRVEKFAGGWSVGRTEYQMDGAAVALNAWHQDQVVELPAGARVLASSNFCANAVLAYGDNIWTIQPHPEFSADFIDGLIKTRGKGVVPDDQLAAASTVLKTPTDNAAIADKMAQFFKRKARA